MNSSDRPFREAPRDPPRKGRLYTHVVYVRVTEAEWQRIHRRAQQHGLSLSRLLVRAAFQKRGVRLPTPEERDRLERLAFQLQRAALSLRQLAALRVVEAGGGRETVRQLQETALLLDGLCRQLNARLVHPHPKPRPAVDRAETEKP